MSKYSVLLVALFGSVFLSPASAQKIKPKVKIGRDTTYVDGPLTKDGYIDYVAHLNAILSKGVTPENNAAVLLLKASPGEISDEKFLKRYCKAMGIAPLSLDGDYYQDYFKYSFNQDEKKKGRKLTKKEKDDRYDSLMEDFDRAMDGPWKRDEMPQVAKWLESNEKQLELVRKATLRKRYYHPMLNGEDEEEEFTGVIAVLLPQAQATREFARVLVCRVNMNLAEGEIDKCFEDLLTMRRLGNHVASGATLVEQLVGIAICGIAQGAERTMAFSGKLTADQLLEYRSKMKQVPMKSSMVRSFGQAERFMYLDAVQMVMRGGLNAMSTVTGLSATGGGGPAPQTTMRKMLDTVVTNSTDWSMTMREGNRIYDKYSEILKSKDWKVQDEALDEMESEIDKISESFEGTTAAFKALLGGPEYRGKLMGKVFTALLLPALQAVSNAEKRATIMDDISYIVLSAAAHKAEHGSYPESIEGFQGEAGKGIPNDRYAEDSFRYQRKGEGFLVYSIGPNRKDDGGNGVYNEKYDSGDDYAAGFETFETFEKK